MGHFTDSLVATPLKDWRNWVLRSSLGYVPEDQNLGGQSEAPSGFVTDFASIPPPVRWVIPQWGSYGYATVIHDWLYWHQDRSRAQADRVFLEAMETLEVFFLLRWVMYIGVSLLGALAWSKNQWEKDQGFDRVLSCDQVDAETRMGRPGFVRCAWRRFIKKD